MATASNSLTTILDYKDSLLEHVLLDKELLKKIVSESSDIDTTDLNYFLIRNVKPNIHSEIHRFIVRGLIDQLIKQNATDPLSKYLIFLSTKPRLDSSDIDLAFPPVCDLKPTDFIALLEELHTEYLNTKYEYVDGHVVKTKSKFNLMSSGSVYTPDVLADSITEKVVNLLDVDPKSAPKILDLGSGTGRFFLSAHRPH